MFLQPDDHLIIMDMHADEPERRLTADEMKRLCDAGVQTIFLQAAIRWDIMQPTPDAPFDWSYIDRWVEMARSAGLKMLLPFIYSFPRWKPDWWFFSRAQVEQAYGVPSYTNQDVIGELTEMLHETIARYSAPDLQVFFSIPCNAELPFHLFTTDNACHVPEPVLLAWLIHFQTIFEAEHGEIWTAYHPYCDPVYWKPVYSTLFESFPHSKHYGFIFTYVQRREPHFFRALQYNQERGLQYYGGTEYIQGLRANVPKLIGGNMRMLTAPKHPYQHVKKIDDWAISEIKWALEQYQQDWIRL